ncbi:hypothetical protein CHUAL_002202 [Chamberlinius hualienensis]
METQQLSDAICQCQNIFNEFIKHRVIKGKFSSLFHLFRVSHFNKKMRNYVWVSPQPSQQFESSENNTTKNLKQSYRSAYELKSNIQCFIYSFCINGFSIDFSLEERADNRRMKRCRAVTVTTLYVLGFVAMLISSVKETISLIDTWNTMISISDEFTVSTVLFLMTHMGTVSYLLLFYRRRTIANIMSQLILSISKCNPDESYKKSVKCLRFWAIFCSVINFGSVAMVISAAIGNSYVNDSLKDYNCNIKVFLPHLVSFNECDSVAAFLIDLDFVACMYRVVLSIQTTALFCFVVYLLTTHIRLSGNKKFDDVAFSRTDQLWNFQMEHKTLCYFMTCINECFSSSLLVWTALETAEIVIFIRIVGLSELKADFMTNILFLTLSVTSFVVKVLVSSSCNSQIGKILQKVQAKIQQPNPTETMSNFKLADATTFNFHLYTTRFLLTSNAITALGYFDFNKRLLASVTGTVVTYALMFFSL